MRAFLWAVLACIVIGVGAGYILTGIDFGPDDARTASTVRLD